MSFSRLKPLPKAIIIGVVVAVLGVAANYGLKLMPKKAPTPEAVAVEVTPVPAEQPAPAPAPVAQTPKQAAEAAVQAANQQAAPQPAPTHDAGLSAVLGAGKK